MPIPATSHHRVFLSYSRWDEAVADPRCAEFGENAIAAAVVTASVAAQTMSFPAFPVLRRESALIGATLNLLVDMPPPELKVSSRPVLQRQGVEDGYG